VSSAASADAAVIEPMTNALTAPIENPFVIASPP